MARKQFSVPQSSEDVEFDLEGKTFRCRPRVAAGLLMKFASVMGTEDDEESVNTREVVAALRQFFEAAIIPEDFGEFWDIIEDPDIAVPVSTLAEIANWLAEQYTERPTGAPSSSGRSNGSSGDDSTVVRYSRAPTSSRSPQDAR